MKIKYSKKAPKFGSKEWIKEYILFLKRLEGGREKSSKDKERKKRDREKKRGRVEISIILNWIIDTSLLVK